MKKQGKKKDLQFAKLLRRFSFCLVIGYILASILFFILAGEQLRLRNSRGNMQLPTADSGTVELFVGNCVEQYFTLKIQRLEKISVQWGTYYRPNMGTVVMELYDMRSATLLLQESFDASTITEGGLTTMSAETPLEGLYDIPLMLRIYSPDGQAGSVPSPLMNVQTAEKENGLVLNGEQVPGVLCFAASGTDYIWTGLHYWEFVGVGLVILLSCNVLTYFRWKKGKHSYVINAIAAMQKYQFLIGQLVSRDFKTKYKRSVLGIFWSFLNPLLMMLVQYFVFSTIFKSDIENYPVYLLIGIVCFNFFSEACSMSLGSILSNASLITKVYVPKYIYPLTRVMSSVINLGISLIPLLLVCILTGVEFHKSTLLGIYFLFCIVVFSLGLGILLSSAMVFFRDTQFLWNVFSMVWMYATPIFYPESILPEQFLFVFNINPLYYFLKSIRMCVLDGISPEPFVYFQCFVMAVGMLLIGAAVFYKSQDKFILYL